MESIALRRARAMLRQREAEHEAARQRWLRRASAEADAFPPEEVEAARLDTVRAEVALELAHLDVEEASPQSGVVP